MSSLTTARAILTANSMRVHYITCANKIFHNHMTQGIVALHLLGASEERIKSFVDLTVDPDGHGGGLVPAKENGYDPNEKLISDNEAVDLLGKYKSYYQLVNYYDNKLKSQYQGSVDSLIKGEMRKLGDGILAELTHGLIEIGHGYAVGQTGMVVEGLAWLHQGYQPPGLTKKLLSAPFTPGPLSLNQMLQDLSKDSRLKEKVRIAHSYPDRLDVLWVPESSALLSLLDQTNLEIPTDDPVQAGIRLVDIGLTIYIASRKRNEFVLLHGVTGSWSVKQLLPLLDEETRRICMRTFLMANLGMFLMQGSPPLDFSFLPQPGDLDVGWPELTARSIAYVSSDPHCYKLVQVCRDMARSGPPEKQAFYKTGALVALDYKQAMYEDPIPS